MDIDAYLHRIRYSGVRTPTADTLHALHRAHMLSVPFENLDIHLGRPIVLDEEKLFEKIVRQRRGGFCYELNGLFAALLRDLEFQVTMLSARVHQGGTIGREFDHMTLLVQCEERWLADVGFGDSFIEPLRLDDPGTQIQNGIGYRIERQGDIWMMMQQRPTEEWAITYQFEIQPRRLQDFTGMCRWHQESSESHFTQKRICSLATQNGRTSVSDTRLIVTEHGQRREQILSSEYDSSTALKSYFGIEIG